MNTTFKRVVCLIMAFSVMLTTAFCLTGITASAAATNIAKGASASKVLTCDATYKDHPGYRAFDGVNADSNKWAADGATNGTAWLIIDLGKTYDISKVRPHIFKGNTGKRVYYYNVFVASEGDFEGAFSEANKQNVFDGIKKNATKTAVVDSTNASVGGSTSTINANGRYVAIQFVGSNESNTISLYEFEIFSGKEETSNKLIVTCFGDSMTEGMGVAESARYPTILQGLIGDKYLVQNAGDRGELTTDIMARQGGMPIYTNKTITFEEGAKQVQIGVATDRGFVAEDGRNLAWTSPFGRDLLLDKVTINGATYRIKFENYVHGSKRADTYLVREGGASSLKKVTIPEGSKAIFEVASVSKSNYCDIYFMGFNGGYSNVDELVSQYQKMIQYRGNDRYIIVIPYNQWDKTANIAMYNKFKAAFGNHAVDFVGYLNNGGMEAQGFTPTAEDKEYIAAGIVPLSLRLSPGKGDIHLNANGYKILAQAIYEHGRKVGLFGGVKEKDPFLDTSSNTSGSTSTTTSLEELTSNSNTVSRPSSNNTSSELSASDDSHDNSTSQEDIAGDSGEENLNSDTPNESQPDKEASADKADDKTDDKTEDSAILIVLIVILSVLIACAVIVLAVLYFRRKK